MFVYKVFYKMLNWMNAGIIFNHVDHMFSARALKEFVDFKRSKLLSKEIGSSSRGQKHLYLL